MLTIDHTDTLALITCSHEEKLPLASGDKTYFLIPRDTIDYKILQDERFLQFNMASLLVLLKCNLEGQVTNLEGHCTLTCPYFYIPAVGDGL